MKTVKDEIQKLNELNSQLDRAEEDLKRYYGAEASFSERDKKYELDKQWRKNVLKILNQIIESR